MALFQPASPLLVPYGSPQFGRAMHGTTEVTPESFANLALWWRMDDQSGADGSNLSVPIDLSGNGRDGNDQGTTATLLYNQLNGHRAMHLLNSGFYTVANPIVNAGDVTISFTTKHITDGVSTYVFGNDGTLLVLQRDPGPPANNYIRIAKGGGLNCLWTQIVDENTFGTYTITKTDSACECYFNGAKMIVYGTQTISAVTLSFENVLGVVGFEAYVPEFIIYTQAMSQNDQESLAVNYQNSRYALEPKTLDVSDGNSLVAAGGLTVDINVADVNTVEIINLGVGGQSIGDMIADFPSQVAPLLNGIRPNYVVVAYEGTNSNLDTYVADYKTYLALVKAANPAAKRVAVTILAFLTSGANELKRLAANDEIRTFVDEGHAEGVADPGGDVHFNSLAATANTTYYIDQTHLTNDVGYPLMASYITPVVNSLI